MRELLRRLRDLCVGRAALELGSAGRVWLGPCLSADQPVERGVRHALEHENGRRRVLALRSREGALELELCDDGAAMRNAEGESSVRVALASDRFGRLMAPELGARIDLAVCEPLAVERFLRRLARAALARVTSKPAN